MVYGMLQITGLKRQILISLCIHLGQMMIGFTVGWSGPILPLLRDYGQSQFEEMLSESQLSLVASLAYIGCIPGPYVMGWLSNMKGRKPCLVLGGFITTMAYIVLATAKTIPMLYCGRFMAGVGVGITGVMNLVYIGELASTNVRGIFLTVMGIFTTLGSIVLYTSAHFLAYSGINYVGVASSVVFTLSALLIPESPMFHILKGNDKAVVNILQELGRSEDIDNFLATKKDFQENTAKKDWIDLFKLRSNRKALLTVVTVNIFQHCSGVMVVIFFAGTIFEMAGSSINSNTSMLIIGAFQLTGSVISPFLVERAGRKILLIVSSAICSTAMLLLGFYFYLDHIGNAVIDNMKWFPLVILILFFVGYDFGLGIIPNALIGEMFTTNVRSKGSAVTLTITWVVGFLITTAFGTYVEIIGGHVVFWIFSGTCLCCVIFTMFCVLETKGKTFMEIQEILSRK